MARSKEFPQGSSRHGYEFVAARQHIDAELWKQHRDHCRVRRFWEGEADERGFLIHRPSEQGWSSTTIRRRDDDESGYRFGDDPAGICISNEEGEMHTFRVVTLEPVT